MSWRSSLCKLMTISKENRLWYTKLRLGRYMYYKLIKLGISYNSRLVRYFEIMGWSVSRKDGYRSVGLGWRPMLMALYDLCEMHRVLVTQVKEKFGGLRFYVVHAPPHVQDMILAAGMWSLEHCEWCGKQARPRGHWIWTLCDECWELMGQISNEQRWDLCSSKKSVDEVRAELDQNEP